MNRVKDQLNVLKNWINTASALIREFRINDNCFTRTGKISHQQLLLYGLVNAPGATSENLVDLYLKLGVSAEEIPTKQALSQKRKLINEQPFCLAYKNMVSDLYRPENRKELKTFNGFFTVGIDGSDIAVPNNPSLKEIFGTVGRGGLSVTARGSVALDLLNRAPLDGLLAPVKEGERADERTPEGSF